MWQSFHYCPLSIFASHRIRKTNLLRNSIRPITHDCHGDKFPWQRADKPVMHMVTSCTGSRSSRTEFPPLNNFSSSFGDFADIVGCGIISGFAQSSFQTGAEPRLWVVQDGSMVDIWILGERVVAPNGQVFDVGDLGSDFISNLVHSSVLVESSESSEVLTRDVGGEVGTDHGIGIDWVSHDHHFAVSVSEFVNGLALSFENETILS